MDGEDRFQNIDRLITHVRNLADVEARTAALELVEKVMEFHAAGIDRMMEISSEAGDAGWTIIDQFGDDPLVSSLLLLHGLHPLDLETRVRDALNRVRPYLRSHSGDVELLGISGGAVRLKLIGSCDGCPSSSLTLKTAVEKAILAAAPEVTSIESTGDKHGENSAASLSGAA